MLVAAEMITFAKGAQTEKDGAGTLLLNEAFHQQWRFLAAL